MTDRTDPTFIPWTVSIAVNPGDEPCPALETLDRALKKTRKEPDPAVEALKDMIIWPQDPEPEQWTALETWMSREASQCEIEYAQYLNWLTNMICACFQVPRELLDD